MADTGGDFELFQGPAAKEKSEMSDEKFRDEMKKMQQALAQLQKEEGKAKANDHKLATILIQFLSQPENTDLFLLISRAIAQDIPSELILAVISLIDKKASEEVKGYLMSGAEAARSTEIKALIIPENKDFKSLPPEQKQAIDKWIATINEVAHKKPHRILSNLIVARRSEAADEDRVTREISPALVQLSAFILRNYLTAQNVSFEFTRLKDFMQAVFLKLVKDLSELVEKQKHIK
jgi:hypothetical protein